MNLVLIGYRGTGKSTVARLLAKKLGMEVVSLDQEIVRHAGRSIPEIVAEHGWPHFRDIESEVTKRVAARDNVIIDDNCLIDAKGDTNRGIRIADGVFVGRNTILSCKDGDIELAEGANLGFNCEVFSASRVTIGKRALLAAYSYVIGGDHDFSDPSKPVLDQARKSAGVTIGDGAWVGAGAKILDGVTIGDHGVIGAGAVVRESVPASAIAVGVPARVVASR